eukprot:gene23729-biopygen10380
MAFMRFLASGWRKHGIKQPRASSAPDSDFGRGFTYKLREYACLKMTTVERMSSRFSARQSLDSTPRDARSGRAHDTDSLAAPSAQICPDRNRFWADVEQVWPESVQIRGRFWASTSGRDPDSGQILCRFWADPGQIPSGIWADPGQIRFRCVLPDQTTARFLLGDRYSRGSRTMSGVQEGGRGVLAIAHASQRTAPHHSWRYDVGREHNESAAWCTQEAQTLVRHEHETPGAL